MLEFEKRSTDRFVQIELEVKHWLQAPPSVEAARPGKCPSCGVASRPVGERLRLHGHGVRRRQVRGPRSAEAPAEVAELVLRRYRCTACEAVIVVGPRGLVRRRLFSGQAIALALARWGLVGESAAEVRRRVSPWRVVGAAAASTWASLRRWANAVRERRLWPETAGAGGGETARQISARAARRLAALALSPGPLWIGAFGGAARAR